MTEDLMQVKIFVESRYLVDRKRIKKTILDSLSENGVKSGGEISIAIVGDRKMKTLNKKYRNLDRTTNVLSFPLQEGDKAAVPGNLLYLGDIVIAYPQVIREAAAEEVLVDDKIDELLVHSLQHLLGNHHEEEKSQTLNPKS